MANKITTILDLDDRGFKKSIGNMRREIAEADGATNKFKAGVSSLGGALKANVAVASIAAGTAVVAFAAKSVAAASDLQESSNAVSKSFGDAAEGVLEIGENAAESFGLSKAEFNEAAVAFASFAQTVAGPGGDVANVIEDMTTRAADFASVMNIEVAEAATVFRSGLSGETEPLKKFGIDLSAAAVEAYALATGLVKSKKDMTESIKVQARYGLLMEKTSKFAGDFADTSDGLANSMRRANSRIIDFQAEVGEKLIPTVASAVNVMMDFADAMGALDNALGPVDEGLGNVIKKSWQYLNPVGQAITLIGHFSDSSDEAAESTEGLAGSMVQASIDAALLDKKTADLVSAQEDAAKSAAEQERAQEQTNRTLRAAQQAVNDLMSAQLSAIDSNLGYRNAQAAAREAVMAYDEAAKSGRTSTEELDAAARDAEGAVLAQAAAAVQLAEDQAEANGTSLTAIEKNQLFKNELEALATYASGPLKEALEEYIATLGRIPASVQTSVGFGRAPTTSVNGYRAHGGPVSAGGAYVVGEEGPELLQMGSSGGNVIPNGATVGGGATFNVTINADPNPDVTVRKLREFVRRNGPIQGIT